MSDLSDFYVALDEYRNDFRRSDLRDLKVAGLYDLFPERELVATERRFNWPESWPNSDMAGIYVFLATDLEILYIGKTSMNSFLGARLATYCGYAEDNTCRLKHTGWTVEPRYVLTVGVPDDMPFEAPALEECLISKLKPLDNKSGT